MAGEKKKQKERKGKKKKIIWNNAARIVCAGSIRDTRESGYLNFPTPMYIYISLALSYRYARGTENDQLAELYALRGQRLRVLVIRLHACAIQFAQLYRNGGVARAPKSCLTRPLCVPNRWRTYNGSIARRCFPVRVMKPYACPTNAHAEWPCGVSCAHARALLFISGGYSFSR